ncbi:MAG TPA: 30S ribosomal protein S16 [Verrucomicrobiales bacterium]|jgi:small subunit ribosomal protein S16|nr:30S ribosomal protein S16 [Verrucomicrobiales bacterium]
MAVAIRLRREGSKDRPFYRIVVADSRNRRDGRFIEMIGTYDPMKKGEDNSVVDLSKVDSWIGKGAKASETVASIIRKARKAQPKA